MRYLVHQERLPSGRGTCRPWRRRPAAARTLVGARRGRAARLDARLSALVGGARPVGARSAADGRLRRGRAGPRRSRASALVRLLLVGTHAGITLLVLRWRATSSGHAATSIRGLPALRAARLCKNAVGILSALGILLSVGAAADTASQRLRALAGATIPPLALALYLSGSHASWLALAVGLAAMTASSSRPRSLPAKRDRACGRGGGRGPRRPLQRGRRPRVAPVERAGRGACDGCLRCLRRRRRESVAAPVTPSPRTGRLTLGGAGVVVLLGAITVVSAGMAEPRASTTASPGTTSHSLSALGSGAGTFGHYWVALRRHSSAGAAHSMRTRSTSRRSRSSARSAAPPARVAPRAAAPDARPPSGCPTCRPRPAHTPPSSSTRASTGTGSCRRSSSRASAVPPLSHSRNPRAATRSPHRRSRLRRGPQQSLRRSLRARRRSRAPAAARSQPRPRSRARPRRAGPRVVRRSRNQRVLLLLLVALSMLGGGDVGPTVVTVVVVVVCFFGFGFSVPVQAPR